MTSTALVPVESKARCYFCGAPTAGRSWTVRRWVENAGTPRARSREEATCGRCYYLDPEPVDDVVVVYWRFATEREAFFDDVDAALYFLAWGLDRGELSFAEGEIRHGSTVIRGTELERRVLEVELA